MRWTASLKASGAKRQKRLKKVSSTRGPDCGSKEMGFKGEPIAPIPKTVEYGPGVARSWFRRTTSLKNSFFATDEGENPSLARPRTCEEPVFLLQPLPLSVFFLSFVLARWVGFHIIFAAHASLVVLYLARRFDTRKRYFGERIFAISIASGTLAWHLCGLTAGGLPRGLAPEHCFVTAVSLIISLVHLPRRWQSAALLGLAGFHGATLGEPLHRLWNSGGYWPPEGGPLLNQALLSVTFMFVMLVELKRVKQF